MAEFLLHSDFKKTSFPIMDLALSELRLHNNSFYKWLILIPRVPDAVEFSDLIFDDQIQLIREINMVAKALQELYQPYKFNIATIGNITRQLHIHIVCRYKNDPTFPNVVWGGGLPTQQYDENQLKKELAKIRELLTF